MSFSGRVKVAVVNVEFPAQIYKIKHFFCLNGNLLKSIQNDLDKIFINIFKIRNVSQRRFEKILCYYKSWTSLAMPKNRL